MRTRTVCGGPCIVLLLAAILISGVTGLCQSDKPDDLNQKLSFRVPVGRMEGSFVDALGEMARVFNIPMGISWMNTPSSLRKRAVEYKDATVLEIIQDIAKTEAGYKVKIANNVVHVATEEVPANQNFLYLKIPQFSGNGGFQHSEQVSYSLPSISFREQSFASPHRSHVIIAVPFI